MILGAGISAHTVALHLKRRLKGGHEVIVVSPNANGSWPVSRYGITDRRSGYRAATVSLGADCTWRVSESETTSRAGQSAPEV